MTLGDVLAKAVRTLRAAGIDGAERDARWLLAHALSVPPDRVGPMLSHPVSGAEALLAPLLAARLERRPVSQITGARLFWGRSFEVSSDVLDPRPETETLIAAALEGNAPGRLIDLGTGSGCIAVTLLAEWPTARGLATDLSAAALKVAARNAEAYDVSDRLSLAEGSWWNSVVGRFDLVLSNPPYIAASEMPGLAPEIRLWEPQMALTPGGDGLDAYRAIAAGLEARLAPGGRALFEIGAEQGVRAAGLFHELGFVVRILPDLDQRDRVLEVHRRSD
ncbi:MAG: peptide chain release factor N(5)-glutamine methyltransferase [Pseudomonadota bacterium]